MQEGAEAAREAATAETERRNARADVREMRTRETRLLADYSELEEENISLQKQVAALKSSQVIFMSVKKYKLKLWCVIVDLTNWC